MLQWPHQWPMLTRSCCQCCKSYKEFKLPLTCREEVSSQRSATTSTAAPYHGQLFCSVRQGSSKVLSGYSDGYSSKYDPGVAALQFCKIVVTSFIACMIYPSEANILLSSHDYRHKLLELCNTTVPSHCML